MSQPRSGEAASKVERRRALERTAIRELCPKCGARPGEPCTANELGELAATMHKQRVRLGAYKPLPGGPS